MNFSDEERTRLAALADILIPAGDNMPSASQADVAGRWLDAMIKARADLGPALKNLLESSGDEEPAAFVQNLQSERPEEFAVLADIVPNAYFMNPEVRERVGYKGQVQHPIDPRPDYMEDGLLESVIRRGAIYRESRES